MTITIFTKCALAFSLCRNNTERIVSSTTGNYAVDEIVYANHSRVRLCMVTNFCDRHRMHIEMCKKRTRNRWLCRISCNCRAKDINYRGYGDCRCVVFFGRTKNAGRVTKELNTNPWWSDDAFDCVCAPSKCLEQSAAYAFHMQKSTPAF